MIPESITDRQTANSSFIFPHILETTPIIKYLYPNDYTMVASIKSLSRWALLGMAALANAQFLSIMPLGASITHGVGTDSGNGYRQYLLEHLNGEGFEVDYVGSQPSGTMEDRDNEGYPGLRIEEITDKVRGTLGNNDIPKANVYTINAGTNDATQDFDIGNAGVRMYDMMDLLWSVTPDATVVLSTLILHLDPTKDERAQIINEQFRGLVSDLRYQQGKRIVLAEMRGDDGPQEGDINGGDDQTHPNEEGFKKMATVWNRAILEAHDAGFIP